MSVYFFFPWFTPFPSHVSLSSFFSCLTESCSLEYQEGQDIFSLSFTTNFVWPLTLYPFFLLSSSFFLVLYPFTFLLPSPCLFFCLMLVSRTDSIPSRYLLALNPLSVWLSFILLQLFCVCMWLFEKREVRYRRTRERKEEVDNPRHPIDHFDTFLYFLFFLSLSPSLFPAFSW